MLKRGFTLIEMLVVVGIIGMLLSMGIPALMSAARRADMYATLNILGSIHSTMSQVARTETGDRHVRYGYSVSALGVKPFFQCWTQSGAPNQSYSLESPEYDNYLFPRTHTNGRNLVGKSYDWVSSQPGGRIDTILFEDRDVFGLSDARVGSLSTLPSTLTRLDTSLPTYRMWYNAAGLGSGFSSAPAGTATLNVQFESGTGFTEAMIGQNGSVVSRGTCAEMYLFPGSSALRSSTTAPLSGISPRYKIYVHPTGNLQISLAAQ
jgi:prepilin-type N-terminal cleavage/methylation domain-containing protein